MLLVEFLDAKHGMAEVMNTLMGGPEDLYSKTPDRLASPITALVSHAVKAGIFPSDVERWICFALSQAWRRYE